MTDKGRLADRILNENVFPIAETLNKVLDTYKSGESLVDLEASLERTDVGLSITYQGYSELLNSIKVILDFDLREERVIFLANHFLKYSGDLKEIDLDSALDYVKKISEYFWSDFEDDFDSFGFFGEEKRFYTEEKRLALFHVDFMAEFDKKEIQKRLKEDQKRLGEDGGLERFVLALGGTDARYMSGIEYDNFNSVFEEFSKEKWSEYVLENLFNSKYKIDMGQVSIVSQEFLDLTLDDEDMQKVIKMFKATEMVIVKNSRDRYNDIDRELASMNEHFDRAFFGPYDEEEEAYWFGPIDKSGRPELIRRFLCHTFNLEGEAKKLYEKYMDYQEKRFEEIRKFHEIEMIDNLRARAMYDVYRDEDEEIPDEYIRDQFENKKRFWLTILNTSINCLLDQGYEMPKIIEIAETKLNPFKNESQEIIDNLRPILAREYKD